MFLLIYYYKDRSWFLGFKEVRIHIQKRFITLCLEVFCFLSQSFFHFDFKKSSLVYLNVPRMFLLSRWYKPCDDIIKLIEQINNVLIRFILR